MKIRRMKVLGEAEGIYHCMSRIAGGAALLGRREKEVLRRQIRQVADFCGVEVLTFSVMSNHFHVLVRVPPESERRAVETRELVRRVGVLYPPQRVAAWEGRLEHEQIGEREKAREELLARMGDVSGYLKELKQRFSIWYNRTHQRYGTLWAERFRSVLVEPSSRALLTVACYIDLNPVRAGLCRDPKDYRFCGYAEAVAGERTARKGLCRVMGAADWRKAVREYRQVLFGLGCHTDLGSEGGISAEGFQKVRQKGGKLTLAELLRCRIRYFSDGVAIGSREYVERVFREHRSYFSPRRKNGARRIRGADKSRLYALRDLRQGVVGYENRRG